MVISRYKLYLALANKEMRVADIKSISRDTYDRAVRGGNINPSTVGRLAKELGVSVADLVATESVADLVSGNTGKWKRTERDIGMNYPEIVWTCSECGEFTSVRGYKYCPHCGSRNEEE